MNWIKAHPTNNGSVSAEHFGMSQDYVLNRFVFLLFALIISLARLNYTNKNVLMAVVMDFWLKGTHNPMSPQMGFTCHLHLIFVKENCLKIMKCCTPTELPFTVTSFRLPVIPEACVGKRQDENKL